ncbi:MAG: hypothetical protein QOJ70_842 [Acidobacteriota bacterium]|jgi:hypothetical protein|nr:hypothetical protein [Acidobacteriota bacterium]MDT7807029.1 hypothetical protein [Acidobacteriota bacterium]
MREFFNTIFHAGAAQPQGRGDTARVLARFAVLGAFVLGIVPGAGEAFAQARKASGAGVGVKKTAKTESPKPDGAKAEASKTVGAKAESGKVNIGPIKAFLARSKNMHEQGKLDLSKPRTIIVEGDRQEDGTLTNTQITGESATDPALRAVAQDFLTSVNDSHALAFLNDVSRVTMTFTLDGERFKAITASDAPTEARAEEMARGYRMMVNFGRLARRGTDEGAILSNMKVSASGKQLLMNLDMPREQMGNILLKQITPN